MFYNKVEICGVNTSDIKVLNDNEKKSLLDKIKNGDERARKDLIYGNLRLVLSIIKRFSVKKDNADDLFQVGCLGLVKAIDNFNTDLEVKFSTYAVPMIIGEIRRYLRDNSAIRISRSIKDLAYRALQAREEMQNEKESEPSVEEIAQRLNVEKQAVANALEAIVEPMSIYDPVYSDGGDSLYLIDQLADGSSADDGWLESIALKDALRHLSEREKKIISMRYFQNRTQTEIANEIGISQAQVSRVEKNALIKLKKEMT